MRLIGVCGDRMSMITIVVVVVVKIQWRRWKMRQHVCFRNSFSLSNDATDHRGNTLFRFQSLNFIRFHDERVEI